jgi:glutamine amidotransferase
MTMTDSFTPDVAIVDFHMGNLFSVQRACEHAGLTARITSSREDILGARAVILPGVGAFGDAMETLHRLDLVSVIREVAQSGAPLVGICLGLQLLMSESEEFGAHEGIDLIPGVVKRLPERTADGSVLKVPQVEWNRVTEARPWKGTPLEPVPDGSFMYFVHSYYVEPAAPEVVCATTRYGELTFCSAVSQGNIFACQFHPERSGPQGLGMYAELRSILTSLEKEKPDVRV